MDWRDRRPPIHTVSSLILKVYHAFVFKPITIKFGEFTNFWMLFQMTCPILNSIDIEYLHQEKICSYPVPCSFRTWPMRNGFMIEIVGGGVGWDECSEKRGGVGRYHKLQTQTNFLTIITSIKVTGFLFPFFSHS